MDLVDRGFVNLKRDSLFRFLEMIVTRKIDLKKIARNLLATCDWMTSIPSGGARAPKRGTIKLCSQANEGMWGMPGHTEAMKAVVSCDKPGGAAHTH